MIKLRYINKYKRRKLEVEGVAEETSLVFNLRKT